MVGAAIGIVPLAIGIVILMPSALLGIALLLVIPLVVMAWVNLAFWLGQKIVERVADGAPAVQGAE
jgi:hypothetical protein